MKRLKLLHKITIALKNELIEESMKIYERKII